MFNQFATTAAALKQLNNNNVCIGESEATFTFTEGWDGCPGRQVVCVQNALGECQFVASFPTAAIAAEFQAIVNNA